jgi:hypothetical protein
MRVPRTIAIGIALGLCVIPAACQKAPQQKQAQLMFIDLQGISPLRLYIDDKLIFDGKIYGGTNDGTGLDLTMILPLRGRHKFRLITDRGDRTEVLEISDAKRFVLLSRNPRAPIAVTDNPMLD